MMSACEPGAGIPIVHRSANPTESMSSKPVRNLVSKNKEPMLMAGAHTRIQACTQEHTQPTNQRLHLLV